MNAACSFFVPFCLPLAHILHIGKKLFVMSYHYCLGELPEIKHIIMHQITLLPYPLNLHLTLIECFHFRLVYIFLY